MLILSRNIGEVIRIGDEIEVRILGCRGQQVRIGIVAPADISIHREEVYQRIQAEQKRLSG